MGIFGRPCWQLQLFGRSRWPTCSPPPPPLFASFFSSSSAHNPTRPPCERATLPAVANPADQCNPTNVWLHLGQLLLLLLPSKLLQKLKVSRCSHRADKIAGSGRRGQQATAFGSARARSFGQCRCCCCCFMCGRSRSVFTRLLSRAAAVLQRPPTAAPSVGGSLKRAFRFSAAPPRDSSGFVWFRQTLA